MNSRSKLAPFTEDPAEIPALLDDFERRGWLSEARVVEQVLASRRRRFGAQPHRARIARERHIRRGNRATPAKSS